MHKAIVLCYHRVNNPVFADPWELMVSPENFENQLKILSDDFNTISIEELLFLRSEGKIPPRTVGISFDDGYADNFTTALPILKFYDLPATFFLVAGMIGKKEYWWDQLVRLMLSYDVVPTLSEQEIKLHSNWRWPDPPPTVQSERYLKIWMQLKGLDQAEIEDALIILSEEKDYMVKKLESDIMDSKMISGILSYENSTIGVHSMSHPALSHHSAAVQKFEMEECYKSLLNFYGNKKLLPIVAYPYGNFDGFTLEIARSIGFKAGFTTEAKSIGADDNIFKLGRFVVKNQKGKAFRQQIGHWLSL
jgi:peptidoglycan/xylan/chitin deacetylase (PgdA/CDA1 family)